MKAFQGVLTSADWRHMKSQKKELSSVMILVSVVDRRSAFKQQPNHGFVPAPAGGEEGRGAVIIRLLDRGSAFEQQTHHGFVPSLAGDAEGREAVVVGVVDRGSAFEEQQDDLLCVTKGRNAVS